jgi:hypothetical protein
MEAAENHQRSKMPVVLVACEESQAVTIELRKLGVEAYSCDIQECSGAHPEWHICNDVTVALHARIFKTMDGKYHTIDKWDAIIAFPPCTDLAVSGAAWFEKKRQSGEQLKSIEFFMSILNFPCDYIAVENPVNIISGKYITTWFPELAELYGLPISPSQTIQPYYFGDNATKKTCLWLKGFPLLKHDPANYVEGSKYMTSPSGKSYPEWCWKTGKGCGKERSKTYPGIAKALAEQWGEFLIKIKSDGKVSSLRISV